MPKSKRGIVWEDREVLFDLPFSWETFINYIFVHKKTDRLYGLRLWNKGTFFPIVCINAFRYLKLRTGEKVFDRIEPIEDTKGNSGMKGRLVVTNLRIIWHSLTSPRINLSWYYWLLTPHSSDTHILNTVKIKHS